MMEGAHHLEGLLEPVAWAFNDVLRDRLVTLAAYGSVVTGDFIALGVGCV